MIIKGWEAGEIEENKVTIILIIAALHKGLREDAKKRRGSREYRAREVGGLDSPVSLPTLSRNSPLK